MDRYGKEEEEIEVEVERFRHDLEELQTMTLPVFLFHLAFASGTSLRARAADFITMSFTETFAPKSCIIRIHRLED
jgi:hypothetical protein